MRSFWSEVLIDGEDDCWEWEGATSTDGYGVWTGRRYAHRVSYEDRVGPIPPGMMICHLCNNKRCVNPAHLYAGTAKDNAIDRVLEARSLR